MEQDNQLVTGLKKLEPFPQNLRTLYHIAQELGREGAITQILDRGLQTQDSYFLLEKYRLLIEKGEIGSSDALALRKKILSIESEEAQEMHLAVAMIDFQQLSQNSRDLPDCAVAPLLEYLVRYEKKIPPINGGSR